MHLINMVYLICAYCFLLFPRSIITYLLYYTSRVVI